MFTITIPPKVQELMQAQSLGTAPVVIPSEKETLDEFYYRLKCLMNRPSENPRIVVLAPWNVLINSNNRFKELDRFGMEIIFNFNYKLLGREVREPYCVFVLNINTSQTSLKWFEV